MINLFKRVYYCNYYVWLILTSIIIPLGCIYIFVFSFILEPAISALLEIKEQYIRAKAIKVSFSRENYLRKKHPEYRVLS